MCLPVTMWDGMGLEEESKESISKREKLGAAGGLSG